MAIIISLIAAGASVVPVAILAGSEHDFSIWLVLAFTIAVFGVMFMVSKHLLNKFIFEKINPVYKTIQDLNVSSKQLKRDLENKDILSEVNREVQQWAKKKIQIGRAHV